MIKGKKIATLLDFNILTPWTIRNYKTIMQYERKVHQKLPRITNYIVYMYRGILTHDHIKFSEYPSTMAEEDDCRVRPEKRFVRFFATF